MLLVKANLKKITGYKIGDGKLQLLFANGYDLVFELYDEYDEPLSILFYDKRPGAYTRLSFINDDVSVKEKGF